MKKYEKQVQQAYLDSEKRTLKRLEEVYEDSLGEINERIEMLLARDDANLQNVIYQVDYQRALKKQVEAILDNLQNNEFETVSEYLTESYEDGFIGNLYSMQQQGVPFAFPMNQELIVDAIQHETMLTSSLYTELGLDIKRLQKNIAGEISRGIASSMTYAEIARNVSNYSKIPLNRAMLISRTESHRIRETAVAHSQEKAVEKGADLVRVWDSVMDGKTRSKHLHLDGQKRRVNEPFEAGGKKVMRPGQFGDPADDCNCRCMARCVASWALDADETKRLGNVSKMDDERKKEIADKLKIPVDELENYSKEIIPINAKDFDDFKKQYKKIWNPDNSRSVSGSVQKINNGKALENNGKSSTMKMNLQFFANMPEEKFIDYSLNPLKAPEKAEAFKRALGYDLNNYTDLMKNIEEHIDESKFVEKGDNGHGMRYEYIMNITGANGKNANVLTAWIQEGNEKRLVSVYVTKKDVTK